MGSLKNMSQPSFRRGLWFAALLLVAQGLSQFHIADFGIDSHTHDGAPCVVGAMHESSDDDNPATLVASRVWGTVSCDGSLPETTAYSSFDRSSVQARAPPQCRP